MSTLSADDVDALRASGAGKTTVKGRKSRVISLSSQDDTGIGHSQSGYSTERREFYGVIWLIEPTDSQGGERGSDTKRQVCTCRNHE